MGHAHHKSCAGSCSVLFFDWVVGSCIVILVRFMVKFKTIPEFNMLMIGNVRIKLCKPVH